MRTQNGGIMAERNEYQNNAYPPANLSFDPPWIEFPNTNWGASIGPSFSVRLDPQVNVRRDLAGATRIDQGRQSLMEMDQLVKEFAEWNDDLLGELAR
jgi:hypothetical protein